MANVIKLVQGDTKPSLVITLTDKSSNIPLNLTGITPGLKFRAAGMSELVGRVPGAVVDAANGVCVFHWSEVPGILNGEPGNYEGEVDLTYADGTVQTVYETLYFYLRAQF